MEDKFGTPKSGVYKFGVNHKVRNDIPVEWDALAAASPKCLLCKKGESQNELWLEIEKIEKNAASMTWRLWTKFLGELGSFEVRKMRGSYSCVEFSGVYVIDSLFFRIGDKEMIDVLIQHHREIVKNYFFMLEQEGIFIEETQADGGKDESKKQRKTKIPDMPTKKADAYRWVLVWERIETKIENDPTLKIDYAELQEWLKSYSLNLKEDTLRKIITRGQAQKIPPREAFERKNKM